MTVAVVSPADTAVYGVPATDARATSMDETAYGPVTIRAATPDRPRSRLRVSFVRPPALFTTNRQQCGNRQQISFRQLVAVLGFMNTKG